MRQTATGPQMVIDEIELAKRAPLSRRSTRLPLNTPFSLTRGNGGRVLACLQCWRAPLANHGKTADVRWPVEADVRGFGRHSGFDPKQSSSRLDELSWHSGWFSDAVATSRAATACQNILASQHQRLGLEHWTRRLVSGHSAQCLSATTPMAMPRNNKKNAGIQFGSNGTTYLHPVPGVKMA